MTTSDTAARSRGGPGRAPGRRPGPGAGPTLELGPDVRDVRIESDGLRWQLWLRHSRDERCEFFPAGPSERSPLWLAGTAPCVTCGEPLRYPLIDLTGQSRVAAVSAGAQSELDQLRQQLAAANDELAQMPLLIEQGRLRRQDAARLAAASHLDASLARMGQWSSAARKRAGVASGSLRASSGDLARRLGTRTAPWRRRLPAWLNGPLGVAALAAVVLLLLTAAVAGIRALTSGGPATAGQLAFAARRGPDGPTQLWLMSDLGADLRPLLGTPAGPASDSAPALSPDGRWAAFQRQVDGKDEIFVVPADGRDTSAPWRVTGPDLPGEKRFPAWDRGATHLAFATNSGPQGQWEIATADVEQPLRDWDRQRPSAPAAAARLITGVPRAVEPAFSPDGSRLAYGCACTPAQPDRVDIYISPITLDGRTLKVNGAPQAVTTHPVFAPALAAGHPRWSPAPNGPLAFHAAIGGGPFQVWLVDSDGSGPRQLPPLAGAVSAPEWSPDGSRLAVETRGADGAPAGLAVVTPAAGGGSGTAPAPGWKGSTARPLPIPEAGLNASGVAWSVRPARGAPPRPGPAASATAAPGGTPAATPAGAAPTRPGP
jgi:hypothetical protein